MTRGLERPLQTLYTCAFFERVSVQAGYHPDEDAPLPYRQYRPLNR